MHFNGKSGKSAILEVFAESYRFDNIVSNKLLIQKQHLRICIIITAIFVRLSQMVVNSTLLILNTRLIFRRSVPLKFGLMALAIVFVGMTLSASSVAKNLSPEPTDYIYKVTMSKDAAFCRSLAGLYNNLFSQMTKECPAHSEDRDTDSGHGFGDPRVRGMTDFEVWEPEQFTRVGLSEPPYTKLNGVRVYQIDLLKEGIPRTVTITDLDGGIPLTMMSNVSLLKKNANYILLSDEDKRRQAYPEPFVASQKEGIDPAVVDRNLGYDGFLEAQEKYKKQIDAMSPKNKPADNIVYLTAWPNFSETFKKNLAQNTIWRVPHIEPYYMVSERIFIKKDKTPYFIMNSYSGCAADTYQNSAVIVYQVTTRTHNDICYISLSANKGPDGSNGAE